MDESSDTKIEKEESVGATMQVTEANVEVSATEKQEEIQSTSETEAPKSEDNGSEAVSASLDTPKDDSPVPVTEKLDEEQRSETETPKLQSTNSENSPAPDDTATVQTENVRKSIENQII